VVVVVVEMGPEALRGARVVVVVVEMEQLELVHL